ncbi:MAG TPA: hypothetical protein VF746_02720 [Longimicrobium sp.]|jgi:hypothetical protein
MTVLTLAAALLVHTGAASSTARAAVLQDTVPRPRADTIYLGRRDTARAAPRDTARGQPPAPPARRDTVPRPRRDTLYIGRMPPARADTAPPAALTDSAAAIFDAPATRALVERVIRAGVTVPAGLTDYRATLHSAVYLSLRADSAQGGELPVTVDEFAGQVQWERGGGLLQTVRGHRVRMLTPAPYTVGTMLEAPWVVPHLYGNTIDVFTLSATPGARARVSRAVHPFSWRGIDFYRYTSGDTVRVRTREGVTALVPVEVRPRVAGTEREQTVAGTFWVDLDRAAIARARFGFTEREGRLVTLAETGVFFEMENGLVEGRYWLPYRQRRELQISSPLFGGAAAIRIVTALSDFDLNTGWRPEQPGARITRALVPGDSVFQGFAQAVGEPAAEADIADFADLAAAVAPPAPDAGPLRLSLRYERGDHLFRYNRVEGAYLGLGMRLQPRDPDRRTWNVYGTAGYAFSEGAVRGELSARYAPRPAFPGAPQWIAAATGYRRLLWMQPFRPSLSWDLGYSLGAALAGYDVRDYYDAAGGELQVTRRAGRFLARLGGRWERHDSVGVNTGSTLFGTSANDFPLVAPAEPGTHAAVEGELGWGRGSGAFSIGNSLVASLRGQVGFGDFRVQQLTGLLSFRRTGRYVSLLGRGDGGVVMGAAPPQFLYRFGGVEGLRGYDRNEFGGSTALLGRGRLLLHLPPYGNQPLLRSGFFVVPPLRPAIALSADAGWSEVSDESAPALLLLGSSVTDGVRWSYGAGLSFFEDAVAVEYVWPGDGGEGRWYVGFTSWF